MTSTRVGEKTANPSRPPSGTQNNSGLQFTHVRQHTIPCDTNRNQPLSLAAPSSLPRDRREPPTEPRSGGESVKISLKSNEY